MNKQQFIKISDTLTVDSDYRQAFEKLGIRCIDDVFAFTSGRNLTKENLAAHRSRLQFEIESPARTLFLKRYHKTPVLLQIRKWLAARGRKSCASFDYENAFFLSQAGVNTAKIVCFGEEFGTCFEKRSFCISEKIPAAQSLEQTLPDCSPARGG